MFSNFLNFNTHQLRQILNNQRAQSLVEYMVLVALVAAGTIGVVRIVGQNIGIQYENINRALGAKTGEQLKTQNANQEQLARKDLADFLKGSR